MRLIPLRGATSGLNFVVPLERRGCLLCRLGPTGMFGLGVIEVLQAELLIGKPVDDRRVPRGVAKAHQGW